MSRLGFEASGHRAACRWVAVRHGRSSAGNDHVHVVVDLVREDGKVARTANDFRQLSRLCADMEVRYGLSMPSKGAPRRRPCPGSPGPRPRRRAAPDGPKRNGPSWPGWCALRLPSPAAKPSSCGSSGTPGWRPGPVTTASVGIAWSATRWPRSPPTEGWPSSSVGGSWRGTSRSRPYGTAGATARPRARRPPPSGLAEPRRRACTRPLGPAGTSPTAGPRPQSVGASRRSGKSTGSSAQRSPAGWREATEGLGEVVRELGAVPAEDVTTWRAVASDAAGALAVLSGRLERIPGPLAHASGLLARSAQGPRQRPAKAGCVPRGTIKSVAALMAQADLDEDTPAAWRLLFAEMLRVAQAVHDAHLARSESEQAGRLADEARKALENARARLGSLEALRAELLAVVEPAQGEAGRRQEEAARRQRRRAGQRCAAARAVRRDDNGAGTAEAVLGSGEVSVEKRCGTNALRLPAGVPG